MPRLYRDRIEHTDLLNLDLLCGNHRLFNSEEFERIATKLEIEFHWTQDGFNRCVRKYDLHRVINHILERAAIEPKNAPEIKRTYSGRRLKKKEVAQILSCHVRTIDRYISQGKLVLIKSGESKQSGAWVEGDSLDEFLG